MKKITIRKAETLKTTAAFYAGGCGSPIGPGRGGVQIP